MLRANSLLVGLLLMLLTACQPTQPVEEAPPPATQEKIRTPVVDVTPTNSLEPVSWSEIPASLFQDPGLATWADALAQSAVYYRRLSPDKILQFDSVPVTARQMVQATTELEGLARAGDGTRLHQVLQERFQLFRSVGNSTNGDVLVTGYYEPLLRGSYTRSKRYYYPLYRRPPDLIDNSKDGIHRLEKGRPVKYYTRAEIDDFVYSKPTPPKPANKKKANNKNKEKPVERVGKLGNRGLELVWVDNAIDAFFLHIQGSGRVQLENGQILRLGYDSTNGRAFVPIGRILIEQGKIPKEEMTMPRLRQWLMDHPEQNKTLFFMNPSYVFFREQTQTAVGNINVPLTQDRSIATDHRLFPKGAPAILTTTIPIMSADGSKVSAWQPETRLVVNQDTGGAIRGAGRVDLFFGFGPGVENRAGVMKQNRSSLYFIAPRTDQR
ncbi:MAG: transglycosylase [Magnetococcales bacterium]|nr:transglycosylase [Magnetococcales bacterium]